MSAVPNVEAAKSLSQAGVASTNADPTATSGSVLGPVISATRDPTPSVTAPAASPASAASPVSRRVAICCVPSSMSGQP